MNKYIHVMILLLLTICVTSSCAQTKPCKYSIKVGIDNLVTADEKDNLLEDTLTRKITLFFEQKFNDSAVIMVNNRVWYKTRLKTHHFLGAHLASFDIDYSVYSEPPQISIFLIDSKQCVSFKPVIGKRLAFINNIEGVWNVELSNIVREYR